VNEHTDAVVVGSGPNGLTAAVVLAQAGLSVTVLEQDVAIGGGTRTAELTLPGLLHDICSAIHPLGVSSPILRALPLAAHGLEWCHPEIPLCHPLDGGRAATLHRSLEATAAGLGADGARWTSLFAPIVDRFDLLAPDVLAPLVRVPRHPGSMVSFGLRAALPTDVLVRALRTDAARALFAGNAAHVLRPFDRPATSSVGVVLTAAAHRWGWPVSRGGSRSISDALASLLVSLGGTIHTEVAVRSLGDLPPAKVALFDTAPSAFADIAGAAQPARVQRSFRRWRHGPGACKLDLAVDGGIPWRAPECARAGTVHVGGSFAEVSRAEREVHRGRMPVEPFVLVGQQYLADPSRSNGDVHPVWAYAHVPAGFDGDATTAMLDQIERFAPGTRERVIASRTTTAMAFERYNPNYLGGDVATGANSLRQMVARPRLSTNPYFTGVPGMYLCSAATPPGAGVHGMCGYHAARSALRDLCGTADIDAHFAF
jgi:phytoene dehydrogenase-like protein